MTLRPKPIVSRRLIMLLSSLVCAYVLLAPTSAPSLGSIECAAPQYFDTLTAVEPQAEHETGMHALRQQAGLALAQLQTRTASSQ